MIYVYNRLRIVREDTLKAINLSYNDNKITLEEYDEIENSNIWRIKNYSNIILGRGKMDKEFCTIYDCEFDGYQKGVVADNIVYAIDDDGNQAPAREYICEYVDFGMVQFYTGYYDESGEYLERKSSKWGYFQLSTGKVLIPPIYDYARPFYGDRAMVEKDKKYGFIDPEGNEVVEIKWDETDIAFHKAPSWVRGGDKYGYIDKHGQVVIPLKFELAKGFKSIEESYKGNRYVALVKKGGKYGYIDEKGNYIFEPSFEDAKAFWNFDCNPTRCFAPVKAFGKWGFIDLRGKVIVDFQFDNIGESKYFYVADNTNIDKRSFGNHRIQFYTVKKDGQWGLMNGDFDIIMQDEGQQYVVYRGRRVYMKDGRVTSIRK